METMMSKLKQFVFGLALMAVVLPNLALADSQSATYRVTFTATWSNKTHPHAGFPAHAFFSPLIGGVHNDQVVYWKVGELASPGIKLMAEEGIADGLASDAKADIDRGLALAVLSKPMTTDSPGSNTLAAFQVTKDFPLVTLVIPVLNDTAALGSLLPALPMDPAFDPFCQRSGWAGSPSMSCWTGTSRVQTSSSQWLVLG